MTKDKSIPVEVLEEINEDEPGAATADVETLREFSKPRDARTMGFVEPALVAPLAVVATEAAVWDDPVRRAFVDAFMRLSRSANGVGSEQMVRLHEVRPPAQIIPMPGASTKEDEE